EAVVRPAACFGIVADPLIVAPGVAGIGGFKSPHLPPFSSLPGAPDGHEQASVGQLHYAAIWDRLSHRNLDRLVALPRLTVVGGTVDIGIVAAHLATWLLHELLIKRPQNRAILQPRHSDFSGCALHHGLRFLPVRALIGGTGRENVRPRIEADQQIAIRSADEAGLGAIEFRFVNNGSADNP